MGELTIKQYDESNNTLTVEFKNEFFGKQTMVLPCTLFGLSEMTNVLDLIEKVQTCHEDEALSDSPAHLVGRTFV